MKLKAQTASPYSRFNSKRGVWQRSKKTLYLVMVLLGCVLSSMIPAHAQRAGIDSSLLLEDARIIIGDGSVIESGSILLRGGNIVAVGDRADMDLPANTVMLNLQGKTIIPALIDAHAHLGYEAYTSWGAQNYTRENLLDHLQRYAYYGFSAVFSAGSDPDGIAFSIQREQVDGQVRGARFLFAAGMAPPGQGPNDQFLAHALALEEQTSMTILYGISNEQQAIDAVNEVAGKGISVIKIWVDDRGGSQQKLSPGLYRVIIEQATNRNIQVFVHQQYATDMPALIRAGAAGFLHGRLGSELDENIAQQLRQAQAFVVPNLGLGELRREAIGEDPFLQAAVPNSVAARLTTESGQRQASTPGNNAREEELKASFASLIEAGVDILLGTDAGAVPDHFFGYTGHRELEIFVRLGMTEMQALVAATSKPAQRLGLEDLGLLKQGYSADLLVLDSNPLDDIRNTRSISRVYLGGAEIDRERLRSSFTNE